MMEYNCTVVNCPWTKEPHVGFFFLALWMVVGTARWWWWLEVLPVCFKDPSRHPTPSSSVRSSTSRWLCWANVRQKVTACFREPAQLSTRERKVAIMMEGWAQLAMDSYVIIVIFWPQICKRKFWQEKSSSNEAACPVPATLKCKAPKWNRKKITAEALHTFIWEKKNLRRGK